MNVSTKHKPIMVVSVAIIISTFLIIDLIWSFIVGTEMAWLVPVVINFLLLSLPFGIYAGKSWAVFFGIIFLIISAVMNLTYLMEQSHIIVKTYYCIQGIVFIVMAIILIKIKNNKFFTNNQGYLS